MGAETVKPEIGTADAWLQPPDAIIAGVVGHRDLREKDQPVLEERIVQVLQDIHGQYPGRELVFLSALAEGADRLAAQAALRLARQGEIAIRLIAVLPMDVTEYTKDFLSQESKDEFFALLSQAYKVITLTEEDGLGDTSEDPGTKRDLRYMAVGDFLARHCRFLIALWDGLQLDKTGGTSHVIRMKKAYDQAAKPQKEDRESVYHIVTPRVSNEHTVGIPFEIIKE